MSILPPIIYINKNSDPTIMISWSSFCIRIGSYEAYRRKFWHGLVGYDSANQRWKPAAVRLVKPAPFFVRLIPQIFGCDVNIQIAFKHDGNFQLSELQEKVCTRLRRTSEMIEQQGISVGKICEQVRATASISEIINLLAQYRCAEILEEKCDSQ